MIKYLNDKQVKASDVLSAIAFLTNRFGTEYNAAETTVLEAEQYGCAVAGTIEVRDTDGWFVITVD